MDLTPYEFSALVDYQRRKQKSEYEVLRNVIYNAGLNLMRKKGQKEIPLFGSDDNLTVDIDKAKKEREELFGESQ